MRGSVAWAVAACLALCAILAAEPPAADTWTVKKGDTLSRIAVERYGHQLYGEVLALYNNVDPAKLQIGQIIKMPDLRVILKDEKLIPLAEAEMDAVLKAREVYLKHVAKLWDFARQVLDDPKRGPVKIPEDMRKELLGAADSMTAAAARLRAERAGVAAVPARMVGQIEQAADRMRAIADGLIDENGYIVDEAQQRIAYALINGIKWARNGFK